MICPKCGKMFNQPQKNLWKRKGRNYLTYSCPICKAELSEQRIPFSQGQRLLIIVIVLPLIFFVPLLVIVLLEGMIDSSLVGVYFLLFLLVITTLILLYSKIKRNLQNEVAVIYNSQLSDKSERTVTESDNEIYKKAIAIFDKPAPGSSDEGLLKKKTVIIFSLILFLIIILNVFFYFMVKSDNEKLQRLVPEYFSGFLDIQDNEKILKLEYVNGLVLSRYPEVHNKPYPLSREELIKEYEENNIFGEDESDGIFKDISYSSDGEHYEVCSQLSRERKCFRDE